MSEKLFVIGEVVKTTLKPASKADISGYKLADADVTEEIMWLKPSRIIPASRLRYDHIKKGDSYFESADAIAGWSEPHPVDTECEALILDPPEPEAKDEFQWWATNLVESIREKRWGDVQRHFMELLKRMPRKE